MRWDISLCGMRAGAGLALAAAGWLAQPRLLPASGAPPVGLLGLSTGPTSEVQGKPGPWGRIISRPVFIEASDEAVAGFRPPAAKVIWSFPGWGEEQARALFERAGLTAEFRRQLLLPESHSAANGVLRYFPPPAEVEAMMPAQRAVVYSVLGTSPMNEFQSEPVCITTPEVDEWLAGSALPAALKSRFGGLCYRRGGAWLFSDLPLLTGHAAGANDGRELLRVYTRHRVIAAKVEIAGGRELRAAASYWSGGGRNGSVAGVFREIEEGGVLGPARIEISRLLPPLPRRLLGSYPVREQAVNGRFPDCHWSALNFFNDPPDSRLMDLSIAAQRLLGSYLRIRPPYEFGDVLTVLDAAGAALHSCVFVADNLVFTKNGSNLATPWILMTVEDLSKIYLTGPDRSITGWRLKPLEAAPEEPSAARRSGP